MEFKDYYLCIDEKFINLEHVSCISLDYSRDKIIFQMDYAIQINEKNRKDNSNRSKITERRITTGYIVVYGIQDGLNLLKTKKYFNQFFIQKGLKNDVENVGYINLEKITSIKYEPDKNRVIINFSNTVSYYDFEKGEVLTSEFLYLNFLSDTQYENYVEYLNGFIS